MHRWTSKKMCLLSVNCARGTYMNPSSGSCELCPQGQYTDHEKQVRCQSCDLGYTTEFSGASSSSHCYSKSSFLSKQNFEL